MLVNRHHVTPNPARLSSVNAVCIGICIWQISPEGAKARNMAADTMLHCALKAQPNNKVRSFESQAQQRNNVLKVKGQVQFIMHSSSDMNIHVDQFTSNIHA